MERVANAAETQQEEIRQEGIGLGKKKKTLRGGEFLFLQPQFCFILLV